MNVLSHGLNGFNGLGAFKCKLFAPNPLNPFNPWLKNVCLLVFFCVVVPATHGQQSPTQQPFTIQINTQLVVETVVVKDKDGKNIEGLTEKDFTVTEDGVPQSISVFQFQKLEETPLPAGTGAQPAELVQ